MIDRDTIYTDAHGRPIEGRPSPLPANASTDDKILDMRAWADYSDRVLDVGCAAFSKAFNKRGR